MEMAFDLLPRVEMAEEAREFQIHLCQTVGGRKPLFEIHSYSNFKELANLLRDVKYNFIIKDEYGNKMDVEEFIKYMIECTSGCRSRVGTDDDPDHRIIVDDDGFEFMDCDFF